MVQPIEGVLHENVFPWVLDRMIEFLYEDDFNNADADDLVGEAFQQGRLEHLTAI